MGDVKNQKAVFEFFKERFMDQEPFTRKDVHELTDWKEISTYWSKHFKELVVPAEPGKRPKKFRLGEAFRRVSNWPAFRGHVTQMRRSADYTTMVYDRVLVFEFFMPLTNETHLRTTLNALFYRDTVLARLRSLGAASLERRIPREDEEDGEDYFLRVCDWVSDRFGGYSISHVSGRFRAAELATFSGVAAIQQHGGRYLVDETTAIVRFIFPCGVPARRDPPLGLDHFDEFDDIDADAAARAAEEAAALRWLFGVLFVRSIVQVVNGEDEIWMLESGIRNRLHIFRIESED